MTTERDSHALAESLDALVGMLGAPADELRALARSADDRYGPPQRHRKRSGGVRLVHEPDSDLKRIQRRVSAVLWPRVKSPIAYGIPGRTREEAARAHECASWVATLDIKDFFPSIRTKHVQAALSRAGFPGEALDTLVALVTRRGQLVQGPPSSPAVACLVLSEFDHGLALQGDAAGLTVTRYVDDIAISGMSRQQVQQMLRFVIQELRGLGLPINRDKVGLVPRHKAQLLHGLTLNNGASIPKRKTTAPDRLSRDQLRSAVRRAQHYGATDAERARLMGQISCLIRLHPREAQQLRRALMSHQSLRVKDGIAAERAIHGVD